MEHYHKTGVTHVICLFNRYLEFVHEEIPHRTRCRWRADDKLKDDVIAIELNDDEQTISSKSFLHVESSLCEVDNQSGDDSQSDGDQDEFNVV